MFHILFVWQNCLLSLIIARAYIQLMVSPTQECWPVDDDVEKMDLKVGLTSSTFNFIMLFYNIYSSIKRKQYMDAYVSYKFRKLVTFAILNVPKAYHFFLGSANLGMCDSSVEPYLTFDNKYALLKVLRKRCGVFLETNQTAFGNQMLHEQAVPLCFFAFDHEDERIAAFGYLAMFSITKLKSDITDIHLLTISQKSLKR